MGRNVAISEKPHTRRSAWQSLRILLGRLQDPKDVHAAIFMAMAILAFEAAVCPLIIAKVPCKLFSYLRIQLCLALPASILC